MNVLSGAAALVAISVSAAVVTLLSPDGEMKKYIKLLSTLAVLAAIAVPVASTLAGLPDAIANIEEMDFGGETGSDFDAVALSKAQIEKSVAEQIEARFSLDTGSVKVAAMLDASDTSAIVIEKVSIGVPRGTDTAKVKTFADELFKNTTEVTVYEVGDG